MHKTKWQLGQLDALRGIAVLGVLLVHSTFFPQTIQLHPSRWLATFASAGQRGVQLFYMLSAFTLALSQDRRRTEHRPLRNFFLRRFFRIAPMFYLAVLLTWLLARQYSGGLKGVLLALTFTNGFHPLYSNLGAVGGWSVADEAIFYACLPLILLVMRSARSAAVVLCIVSAVSRLALPHLMRRWPLYPAYWNLSSMIVELPVFLSGLLVYFTWKDLALDARQRKQLSLGILCLAVLAFSLVLPFANGGLSQEGLLQESLLLALLLFALLLHPWRIFVNRVTIFLGKISFSVYLLHFYIYFRTQPLLRPLEPQIGTEGVVSLTILSCLLLVIPLATLSWHFIEKPGMALGARLIDWLENRESAGSPTMPLTAITDTPEAQF